MNCAALAVLAAMASAGPATAGGFGVGFGAPIEERVGGDYGPEYYRNLHAPFSKADDVRGDTRCRTKLVQTRLGLRRIRSCR
jgi:hypothetical protein